MAEEANGNMYFRTALAMEILRRGSGTQKLIASETGLSPGYLSQLKAGRRNASVDTQGKISGILGYGHAEFLTKGKEWHESSLGMVDILINDPQNTPCKKRGLLHHSPSAAPGIVEKLQAEIISLLKENALLKDEVRRLKEDTDP